MKSVLSTAALLVVAGAANAAVTGFAWREVSNTNSPYPGGAPTTLPAGTRTYDLYVIGNTVGDVINGVNFGGDGSTNHINVAGGAVYNHPLGGDTRSFAFETFFPDIVFDTFATFGGGPTTNGQSTQFAGAVNLTGAGGELRFTSFTQPPAALTAATFGSHVAEIWVLRASLTGTAASAGGGNSVGEIGLAGGALLSAAVNFTPNVPTPGAAALLGLAGLAGARRRR